MGKETFLKVPQKLPDWLLENWHQGLGRTTSHGNLTFSTVATNHPDAAGQLNTMMELTISSSVTSSALVSTESPLEHCSDSSPIPPIPSAAWPRIPDAPFPSMTSSSAAWQALIQQLILAVHQSSDLQDVLHLAVSKVVQILQVAEGAVVQIQQASAIGESRATVLLQWANHPQSLSAPASQPSVSFEVASCPLFRQALDLAPQPLILPEPWDAIAPPLAPLFAPQALGAVLMMPLLYQGTVLGFLIVQQPQPRLWQPAELAWLELVSAQLSTAMMQTYVLRQVQSLVEERTQQLRRSLEVQSKLYETSRRHREQLHRLNCLKDEFLSSVSHELLTPLTSMRMAIQMLRHPGLDPERSDRYLAILDQQCNQEIQLIKDLLALQQLQSQQMAQTSEKVDLRALLPDLQATFQEKWHSRHLTLSLELPDRPLILQADAESVQRILDELLTNAGKFAQAQTTVHLQIQTVLTEALPALVMTVSNVGVGLTAEELPYIFEQFRRGQYAIQQAVPGTGLGLTLVRHLVQHLQGTITATSTALEGSPIHETRFSLLLPQYQSA